MNIYLRLLIPIFKKITIIIVTMDNHKKAFNLIDKTTVCEGNIVLVNGLISIVNKSLMKEILNENIQYTVEPLQMDERFHNVFGVQKDKHNSFEYLIYYFKKYYTKIIFSGDYIFLRQSENESPMDDSITTLFNNDLKRRKIYVHEFQNLYKIIKGEHLTVNFEALDKSQIQL